MSYPNASSAIERLCECLIAQPNMTMQLSPLAGPANVYWKYNFEYSLGRFKDFLLSQKEYFFVDTSGGPGRETVTLLTPAMPKPADDLWRPLDDQDSFFTDRARMENITRCREYYWDEWFNHTLTTSPLYNLNSERARSIFDRAFNKCVRMTMSISYVYADVARSVLINSFQGIIGENTETTQLFLYKDEVPKNRSFAETYCTIWTSGGGGGDNIRPLEELVGRLFAGMVKFKNRPARIYCVGWGPVAAAVRHEMHHLLRMSWRQHVVISPSPSTVELTPPDTPTQSDAGSMDPNDDITHLSRGDNSSAVVRASSDQSAENRPTQHPLPTATSIWPHKPSYQALYEPAVDPSGEHMRGLVRALEQKDIQLRQYCEVQRELLPDDRDYYEDKNGVEWSGDFEIGSGSEARIFMGLLRDATVDEGDDEEDSSIGQRPPPPRKLVAVKLSHAGANPYNSQEVEHYLDVTAQNIPGIVKYHKAFPIKSAGARQTVIVQDIGLCSLADFVEGNEEMSLKPYTLSEEEKFKISKAICLAVLELHEKPGGLAHRDLRPDNILVMPSGRIVLTDFGLARRAPKKFKGTSVYDKNRLTTMQPYEVQTLFTDGTREVRNIRVTHAGDVFMLGLVIAYVHLGFKPFEYDDQIKAAENPNLGNLDSTNPWLHHLLQRMLSHTSSDRPTMEYVLKHPYFLSHMENFDYHLVQKIETVLVRDYKPIDDKNFRMLEGLLAPMEKELAAISPSWHESLPQHLFSGRSKLPQQGMVFVSEDGSTQRDYPLPAVAQLVKWLRNVKTHLHTDVPLQDNLRRTRGLLLGNDEYYATAGDFFIHHPAVCMFLPKLWEAAVSSIQECELTGRRLHQAMEEAVLKFETDTMENDERKQNLAALML